MSNENLVRVFAASGEMEAHLVEGLLQAAGIECILDSHMPSPVLPISFSPEEQVYVLVPASQSEQARKIIAEQPLESAERDE